jgi:hypothetical protein
MIPRRLLDLVPSNAARALWCMSGIAASAIAHGSFPLANLGIEKSLFDAPQTKWLLLLAVATLTLAASHLLCSRAFLATIKSLPSRSDYEACKRRTLELESRQAALNAKPLEINRGFIV